jgi:hypothetical protein
LLYHFCNARETVVFAVDGREEVHGVVGLIDDVDERDDPFEDGSNVTLASGTAKRSKGWKGN